MNLNTCVSFTFYFLYCVHMCVCLHVNMHICLCVCVHMCTCVCGGLRLMTGTFFSLRQSELTELAGPSRHLALGNPLSLGVKGATVPALFFSRGCCGSSLKSARMWKCFTHRDSQTLNSCLDVLFTICVIYSKLFSLCSLYFLICQCEESPKGLDDTS